MYILKGHFGRRGFYLLRNSNCVFETQHKFGIFPNSLVELNGDKIEIKIKNFVGDKSQIYKNGGKIGTLNFYHYRYSIISLKRNDGDIDHFKLEEDGYSQTYVLSQNDLTILKFKASINPLHFDKKFEIEELENKFSRSAIEELIFYVGEILYRKVTPETSPF